MAGRKDPQAQGETPLAQWRHRRGLTQQTAAYLAGTSLQTWRRVELGLQPASRVPVGFWVNAAIVLSVEDWRELLPPEALEWMPTSRRKRPPRPLDGWGTASWSGSSETGDAPPQTPGAPAAPDRFS